MMDTAFVIVLMAYMYGIGSFVTWFLMRDHNKLSENYWRNTLSNDINSAIENGSEINAYGAYLLVKNGNMND